MPRVKPNQEVEEKDPIEEQKKLDESLDTAELNEPESIETFSEKLEAQRQDFYKTYNGQRRLSNILLPIAGLLMAGSFILFLGVKEQWGKINGGCLIGTNLVGMILFFIFTRNKLPNKSKEYIRNFALLSDNYVFSSQDIKNARVLLKKRYAIADFVPDRVYKDCIDIASRNIVEFEYKEHFVNVGELALYKQGAKRNQRALLFVGKYMSFSNEYHFEDRYIINISSSKQTDLPNDIEDLVALKQQNQFAIYGKEGANPEKDLSKEIINNLKEINCGGALLNVNIVLWAGRTAVYLSYDDGIVSIPLDKKLNSGAFVQLRKNILDILEILVK